MIELGKTLGEIRDTIKPLPQLTEAEKIGLLKYFLTTMGEEDYASIVATKESETDLIDIGSFGGYPFLVEGTDEDFDRMVNFGRCPDLRLTSEENEAKGNLSGFDSGVYLDGKDGAALFFVATNNAGGDFYIVPKGVMESLPNASSYADHTVSDELEEAGLDVQIGPL